MSLVPIDYKYLSSLSKLGDCVIIIADPSLLDSDGQIRMACEAIATRVKTYIVLHPRSDQELAHVQAYIMKYAPLFKITSRWKLYGIKMGKVEFIQAIVPRDQISISEIVNRIAPQALRMPQQPTMSISTGGSNKPVQIMEDKHLAEPEGFIPYNQEWRKQDRGDYH